MYNFNVNTITDVMAYRDTATGTNYLQINYLSLDNLPGHVIYSSSCSMYDDDDVELNYTELRFVVLLSLIYDYFDFLDQRNEFFKLMYRFNLQINRRSYFHSTILDGNFKRKITVNNDHFQKYKFLDKSDDLIKHVTTYDGDYLGFDEDCNEVTLDTTKVRLLARFEIKFPNFIFDTSKEMLLITNEINNKRQYKDYSAVLPTIQTYIYLTSVTTGDLDTIINKAKDNPRLAINLVLDIPLANLSDDVKDKINNEVTLERNISIFIKIDTDNMTVDYDSVINQIDELYTAFESRIDGIYLTGIKTLEDDASDSDRHTYYNYYVGIKEYAHGGLNVDNNANRYYILGRMYDGNAVPEYVYGTYNCPVDQIMQYIGNEPTSPDNLGSTNYRQHKVIAITNVDLTAMDDTELFNYLDNYTKYTYGIYFTQNDNFDSLDAGDLDQIIKYINTKPLDDFVFVRSMG